MWRQIWRLIRCLGYAAFAYPFALVTIPLAVLFVGHALLAIAGRFAGSAGSQSQPTSGCAACLAGIVAFAVLTFGYLVAVLVQGWRNSSQKRSHEDTQ